MRKTEAKPGKPAVMKLREDEEQLVIDWINKQTVYADSMRYLIQKDIAENGIRDLQLSIPRIRDIESIRQSFRQAGQDRGDGHIFESPNPQSIEAGRVPLIPETNPQAIQVHMTDDPNAMDNSSNTIEQSVNSHAIEPDTRHRNVSHDTSQQIEQSDSKSTKRGAKKQYDTSVFESFN